MNERLWDILVDSFPKLLGYGVRVTVPPPEACTDNAAMIALVARRLWRLGQTSPLTLDAAPGLRLDA